MDEDLKRRQEEIERKEDMVKKAKENVCGAKRRLAKEDSELFKGCAPIERGKRRNRRRWSERMRMVGR